MIVFLEMRATHLMSVHLSFLYPTPYSTTSYTLLRILSTLLKHRFTFTLASS